MVRMIFQARVFGESVLNQNPKNPYIHIAIDNVCPCVGLFCEDAPLWKCTAGLKLGGRSPGTSHSLVLFP